MQQRGGQAVICRHDVSLELNRSTSGLLKPVNDTNLSQTANGQNKGTELLF